jgi:vacuolar-type H+-ATPase subunit F/Vma7
MKGCVFITMEDSMHAFTMAGFRQVIADEVNVLEVLTRIVHTSEPGLVFVDERLLAEKIMERLPFLEKQWGGAIISLPAPGKVEVPAGKDFGRQFISRVLGYQMKLS